MSLNSQNSATTYRFSGSANSHKKSKNQDQTLLRTKKILNLRMCVNFLRPYITNSSNSLNCLLKSLSNFIFNSSFFINSHDPELKEVKNDFQNMYFFKNLNLDFLYNSHTKNFYNNKGSIIQ